MLYGIPAQNDWAVQRQPYNRQVCASLCESFSMAFDGTRTITAAPSTIPGTPLLCRSRLPSAGKDDVYYFSMDHHLVYGNLLLDFGPLNLGQLMQLCTSLHAALEDHTVVCMYTSSADDTKRANAVHLICCCWQLVLYLQRTPEQAYRFRLSSQLGGRRTTTALPVAADASVATTKEYQDVSGVSFRSTKNHSNNNVCSAPNSCIRNM